MAVAQILRQKGRAVVTVSPTANLKDIADTLSKHRIGAVVVTDPAGAIVGIISERDVVRALAADGASALGHLASVVMTSKVRSCGPRDTEEDLMTLMTEHRIRHLPVVEDGKLAGMISIGDVVKLRIETVEREAEQMKQYIATAG